MRPAWAGADTGAVSRAIAFGQADPAAQAGLAHAEVGGDLADRLLTQLDQLHGALTELRRVGSGHGGTPFWATSSPQVGVWRGGSSVDAVQVLEDVPLTEDEAGYVEAARAVNTMRGYRSHWRKLTT